MVNKLMDKIVDFFITGLLAPWVWLGERIEENMGSDPYRCPKCGGELELLMDYKMMSCKTQGCTYTRKIGGIE